MVIDAEILDRLNVVFRNFFDDDQIVLGLATTAKEVDGWDSVSTIALMVAVEREFGIRFRTGDLASLEDVGQLCTRIAERLRG